MAQSGWRLPDELLKRVRVHCAVNDEAQNVFVQRALESALGEDQGHVPVSGVGPRERDSRPASTRTPAKKKPAASLPKIAPRRWAK